VKAHFRFTHSTAQKSRLAHPRRGSKPGGQLFSMNGRVTDFD
jgi:hypothetical protein